ncbi:voltage-dependent anion channel [Pseudomassariella vexata]|uniref:Voltage-dependent anion channel n=1 Tax=Pseudomassariella vexata TaxID=1141098 RepID=A0A1Y2DN80_9PEZI|nr:voltage-dependent anion channel [Pseudomassariella vexata]ORY60748.1 voltage-dependent anion channel [Pseudomassariella vexata]
MATGGIALLLSEQTQAYRFEGLQTIGKVFYCFDLFVFSVVTFCILYRFFAFKGTFQKSIAHPTEGLFLGTSALSLASIISCIARYGIPACGPWLVVVYRILFWVYFAVTFFIAVGQYTLLFTSPLLNIEDMTPAWDLPIFPFMLCGTIAAVGAGAQPPGQAMAMIVAGILAQGLGMLVSMGMYAIFVWRMIQYGYPLPNSRPGMFIAVGPPSFTSVALIGLADDFPNYYNHFGSDELTIQILRVMATMTSLFIWSLSLWFFCIALAATLAVRQELTFHLNWWAFVFPNVGFTITVLSVGKSLESAGIKWTGTVMSIILVATWIFVFCSHIRAVVRREILYEGKDEDFHLVQSKQKTGRMGRVDSRATQPVPKLD